MGGGVPPLHGLWRPTLIGPGTVPALVLAVLSWRYAVDLADRLPWPWLLLASYGAGLAWLLSLALVDGVSGLTRTMDHGYDYLHTAREVTDVRAVLATYVDRIPLDSPGHWTVHVAGHPPGALLFFVGLVHLGLGGSLAAGLTVTVLAATTAPAVLQTVRVLGAEAAARRAAPFLVLSPAALFVAVSADGLFAALVGWALATLAVAATREHRGRAAAWSVAGRAAARVLRDGVLRPAAAWGSSPSPCCGWPGPGPPSPWPRPRRWPWCWRSPRSGSPGGRPIRSCTTGTGPGWRSDDPAEYWLWGNLAALLLCAGPMLGAGLGRLAELRGRADRVVALARRRAPALRC